MSVPSVGSTTPTTNTASTTTSSDAAQSANLDYNSFLKLLLEQMKSQDPTAPVDQTQMLAQLAQFSSVGQTIQTNTKLDQLLSYTQAQTGASLIGKSVTSPVTGASGIVKSIQITSSGTSAVLQDGSSFDISGGITING